MSARLSSFSATLIVVLDSSPANRRLLYIFSFCSVLVSIQIMHLALADLTLNVALSLGLLCGYVYSYHLGARWRSLTTYVVSLLSLAISVIFFLRIQASWPLFGNYIGILAGLLIVLLGFKAFSPSDHRFMLMFSMVFLLYSSVASFDLKYMLLLPLFLLFSGVALYIANQVEVAVRVQQATQSIAPGQLRQRPQQPILHFAFDAAFTGVLLRAVLSVIVLSSITFILIPHSGMSRRGAVMSSAPRVMSPLEELNLDASLAEPTTDPSQNAEIGLGDDFDLTDQRRLSVNPKPVLKMRSHRSGYLRAKVFDTFLGTGWVESPLLSLNPNVKGLGSHHGMFQDVSDDASSYYIKLIDFPSPENHQDFLTSHGAGVVAGNIPSRRDEDVSYDILRQEITLLDEQPAVFFAVYQPFYIENISLNFNGKMLHDIELDTASLVHATRASARYPKDFSYTVYSMEPRVMPGDLDQIINNPPDPIRAQYTQLPWGTTPTRSELNGLSVDQTKYRQISSGMRNFALTRFALPGADSANPAVTTTLDVVQAIYNFLTDPEEFSYVRGFEYLDSSLELTEAFVMPGIGTQQGYCRQFASAMAVLCRINGIPSRVVAGYAPASYSIVDNAYVYKASDAHAWVEVYFDGYGWVMFDPSPASSDSLNQNEARQWLKGAIDFLQELFVIDPASTRETIMLALASLWGIIRDNARVVMLWGTGCATMLAVAWWGLSLLKRKRPQVFVAENPVVASFLGICANLAQLGFHQRRSQTARSFLGQVGQKYPELSIDLNELIPVYESSAYSPIEVTEQMKHTAEHAARIVSQFVNESKRKRKHS